MRQFAIPVFFSLLLIACGGDDQHPGAGIQGVNYIGVSVGDIERSSAMYAQAAGLALLGKSDAHELVAISGLVEEGVTLAESRLLRSINAQLRFMQFASSAEHSGEHSPVPVQGPGIAHVCYQVNKTTGAYQKFLAAGAQPIGVREMIRLSDSNPVEYAYAHDLDGIMFEVEHVDVAALDLARPLRSDYRIRHVSLATPDMGAALAFYSQLLGGQKPRRAGRFFSLSGEKVEQVSGLSDAALKMGWLQTRNLELEFIQYTNPPTSRPDKPRPVSALGYNMIVFDVTDLDQAHAAVLAAGGKLASEVATMDGGEIFFGYDPDGNLLGFQRVVASAPVSSMNFADNGIGE